MTDKNEELIVLEDRVHVPLRFDTGQYGSRFFSELKEKRIWGCRCPKCKRVMVPPDSYCGRCDGTETNEWILQGDEGTLRFFDVHFYPYLHPRTGKIKGVPWAEGVIELDGGGMITHHLDTADMNEIEVGARYKAVWNEERTGSVHDIICFRKMGPDEEPVRITPEVTEGPPLRELISTPGMLSGKFTKSAGETLSRFLIGLRDDEAIRATRCEDCDIVYTPPTSICSRCGKMLHEWVDLSGQGTVMSFTEVNYDEPSQPYPSPSIYALIKLDGSDTGITHILGEVNPGDLKIGMRVEPVFKFIKNGNILDIKYFKPVSEET